MLDEVLQALNHVIAIRHDPHGRVHRGDSKGHNGCLQLRLRGALVVANQRFEADGPKNQGSALLASCHIEGDCNPPCSQEQRVGRELAARAISEDF
jgi:hypothetical protein